MEVARREKRKPLIRLSDVQKERAAYWLQPPFVLTEPKPTFLNLRVRRSKGRQLESRSATFVEQRYFNYMDTESRPNWPFRFFINDLWKISGQLPSRASFSGHSEGHAGEPATTHHTMVHNYKCRAPLKTVQTVWTVQLNIWVPGRT